jgi:hypothetical protein
MPDIEVLRQRAVRIIAATRFPFIDQEDWPDNYVTITNEYGTRRGIEAPGSVIYPSIIIIDDEDRVREVGEVEKEVTKNQVTKWRLLSDKTGIGRRTKKFFLYVPEGKEAEAERLLEENRISYAGLRTWAVRNGSLIVTSIRTPDDPKDHRGSE